YGRCVISCRTNRNRGPWATAEGWGKGMLKRSFMRRFGAAVAVWSVLATLVGGTSASAAAPGLLRVVSSPALATQILVDGQIADSWGLTWLKLPPGAHTVSFTHVEG